MLASELISRYPQLYHMATAGSWDSISAHGLQTTEHIVTTSGLPESAQRQLLEERRPQSVSIDHPLYGRVVVRDQKPLNIHNLELALDDMSVDEWLITLNSRVFFWLHPERLSELLNARAYRASQHDVITLDTQSLLESEAREQVRLSSLNSGSTIYPSAPTRGSQTFLTIDDYPFDFFRRKRGSDKRAIGELAIVDGLSGTMEHVVQVERWQGPQRIAVLFS